MQDEMMDLMDVSNEIQETLGTNYSVLDDIDEEELMESLMLWKPTWTLNQVQSHLYLQPDKESDLDYEINLPVAPTGHSAAPPNRQQVGCYFAWGHFYFTIL